MDCADKPSVVPFSKFSRVKKKYASNQICNLILKPNVSSEQTNDMAFFHLAQSTVKSSDYYLKIRRSSDKTSTVFYPGYIVW